MQAVLQPSLWQWISTIKKSQPTNPLLILCIVRMNAEIKRQTCSLSTINFTAGLWAHHGKYLQKMEWSGRGGSIACRCRSAGRGRNESHYTLLSCKPKYSVITHSSANGTWHLHFLSYCCLVLLLLFLFFTNIYVCARVCMVESMTPTKTPALSTPCATLGKLLRLPQSQWVIKQWAIDFQIALVISSLQLPAQVSTSMQFILSPAM